MKVYIGADHRGFGLKKKIIAMMEQLGHKVIDLGTYTDQQPCDYPDIAKDVGEHVAKERDARGILVCMSGIGLTIAANKIKGVYAALCCNAESAELSRLHNNANVLVLSAKFIEEKDMFQMLETWMVTPFEGGRHLVRVKKIIEMEERFAPAPPPKPAAPVEREDRQRSFPADEPERRRDDRPGRPTYSSHKKPYRKDEQRHSSAPQKNFSRDNDRSYGRPPRPDARGDRREGSRSSYPAKPPYRKDENRSYGGPKKSYSSEKPYGRPPRPAGRGDDRPSYASRRPDERKMSERQRPEYARERSDRPSSSARPPHSGERKPFSSGKPKFSKPFNKSSSAPRKKFERS